MTVAVSAGEGVLLAHYADLLCQHMVAEGADLDALLAGTGLGAADLKQPGRRLSLSATVRLLANLRKLDGAADLGVRLGAALNIGSHGFLGYAFQSSRTLGDAFALAVRYLRTRTSLFDIRLERRDERALLVLDDRYDLGELGVLVSDAVITSILAIGRDLFGNLLAQQIEMQLPYVEQPYHQHWRTRSDVMLRFASPTLQIRFPVSWLDMPLQTADPQLAALAAARCEEELREAGEADDIVNRVRELAQRYLTDSNALQRIAEELHLTDRTLRRRLQRAGTSFQNLSEQLRQRLALDYLCNSHAAIDEIAHRLGYSDPSNFARAFRRWTGQSPRQYRQSRR